MALSPKSPRRTSASPTAPITANEGAGRSFESGATVQDMAIATFVGLSDAVDARRRLVVQNKQEISLAEAEQLMHNVQLAQRNLTEALNQLSSYRKAVSAIVQARRQEQAQARRQAGSPGPEGLAPTNMETPTP